VGEEGYFKFTLPEKMGSFNGLYVSAVGIPVTREPLETHEPGIFLVDYPLRPGVTRVGLSYTVLFHDGHFVLSEKVLYNIDRLTILSDDPEMKITSESNEIVGIEDPNAAAAYSVEGLKPDDEFTLHFAGGSAESVSETQQAAIQIIPNATENLSFTVMAVLLIALLVIIIIALRETQAPVELNAQLERHKNVLLTRLAKLDDLYETQAVPAAAYYAKRSELKNQLASLIYRLGPGTEDGSGSRRADGKGLNTK
jgi:hypothetical protein